MSGSSDLRSTIEHEYMKMFGDTVVGNYRDDGKSIKESTPTYTDGELAKRQMMYAQHAARSEGSELLATIKNSTKKKGKAKTVKAKTKTPAIDWSEVREARVQEEVVYEKVAPTPVKKKAVYLHNAMGRIKLQVEAVLDSEMAHCLVFADEDDMIFTPNAGETLKFTDENGDTTSVYYADTLFSWTDGNKKLMILFKTNE